jgi:hypothetical protein
MHPDHYRVTLRHCARGRQDAPLCRCRVVLMAIGGAQRWTWDTLLPPGAVWKCSAGAERQSRQCIIVAGWFVFSIAWREGKQQPTEVQTGHHEARRR